MSLQEPIVAPPAATCRVAGDRWRGSVREWGERTIPEETAIAITYDRSTHAVMMASPCDLEDFAVGFSLSEATIATPSDIEDMEIVPSEEGIELRLSLSVGRRSAYNRRRRYLTGPTGCGLCGIESLTEAARRPPQVASTLRVSAAAITAAMAMLPAGQSLHRTTHAVHAAAFWQPVKGIIALREDIGRHNALDKLVGALARSRSAAHEGVVVLTSRVSVEMVQKTATLGAPILIAVSAPTALAVRVSEQAGITLAAIVRGDEFEVFSHPERIE